MRRTPPVSAMPIPELLIAAVAELADLTVLHLDKDFELIGGLTGQPVERLTTWPARRAFRSMTLDAMMWA